MTTVAAPTSTDDTFGPFEEAIRKNTASTVDSSYSEDPPSSDEQLLEEGVRLCRDDQLLPGVRLLRQVKDTSLLNDEHKEFFRRAEIMEKLRADLMAPASEGWTKQGESHGNRDFVTYYKIEEGRKLKCRIESVIEASLFVPLVAVCNETELFDTWFPKWKFPFKLGLSKSKKLKQSGRIEQVIQFNFDLPFPLSKREVAIWGFGDEGGDDSRDGGVKLLSVEEGFDNGLVGPPEKGAVRIAFELDLLFRQCPEDHVSLKKSRGKYPEGEKLILCTLVMYIDPKIAFIPQSLMNFCTRTVIGTIWRMFLHIAEQVRDGERPAHAKAIASKREEIYDWVEDLYIKRWEPESM